MVYAMSDIHGEYEAYKSILEKINFSDSDELYIVGDCVDRGPEPIRLLQDMMCRANVFPIIGNHEYMAIRSLRMLTREITDESIRDMENGDYMTEFNLWIKNGGDVTYTQFQKLSADERADILEYLAEFSLYEEVKVKGKEFVLVHAGLENFDKSRPLEDYVLHELIFYKANCDKTYFEDKYLVTGHKPTLLINGTGEVIMKNNNISIDGGKFAGGRLACVRLDDLAVFYA